MGLAFLGVLATAGIVYHPSAKVTVLSALVLLGCVLMLISEVRKIRDGRG